MMPFSVFKMQAWQNCRYDCSETYVPEQLLVKPPERKIKDLSGTDGIPRAGKSLG